ncbi:uncharacterized protein LOC132546968 [Ylistrum balloti]|uniref:uncharacterized protein LOC132546968 n=1 Tax=Ylistrum balloti TaxID=509963 RepID=UPI002905ECCA|nr:uncharacterized protein LOC132546968 [Ylistrum balloti]
MSKFKDDSDINVGGREGKVPARRRLSSGDLPFMTLAGWSQVSPVTLAATPDDLLTPEESFFIGRVSCSAHSSVCKDDGTESRHHIRLTEVVPSNSSIIGGNNHDAWKPSLGIFTSKKQGHNLDKSCSKRIRSYYKAQDELIEAYEEIQLEVDDEMDNAETALKLRRKAVFYAKLSLLTNVLLFVAKTVASVLSGSISIISSLVDSFVDLAAGLVIWITARMVKRRDPYVYPQGRTKLEPIAIIILSVIMSFASLQLIRESVEKVFGLYDGVAVPPTVDIPTIVITLSAVVSKLVLFLLCRRIRSPSVLALSQDHRNDVVSNSFALIFGYLGSQQLLNKTGEYGLVYMDPIGAMLISVYIIISWCITGYTQIKHLTGHTAKPDFLKKLTWICVNHHPKLLFVDTVRAFHFGSNFLVEVDIVLPEEMKLVEAHDIGETLQKKLERLSEVERAFVHLDYEYEHKPSSEHKTV